MSKLIEYAKQKESEGQFQDALNYYEMGMEEKGCPFDIRKDLGNVLNKTKQYDAALKNFDLVLAMEENHLESLFGKAISYLGLGKWLDSYNYFARFINNGDKQNANSWYYLTVIGNYLKYVEGYDFDEDNLKLLFKKFKECDNESFEKTRLQYHFGLYFDYFSNKLNGIEPEINIKGFTKEFKKFDCSDEEIRLYLKTLDYDGLIDKIKDLKQVQHDLFEKQIITHELMKMGLSEDDIKDIFELESIENLKAEVISNNNEIKFPELDLSVDIPLYVRSPLGEFVFKFATSDYQRIKNVSYFNKYINIFPSMNRNSFMRISGAFSGDWGAYNRNKRKANYFFNKSKAFFKDENSRDGFYYLSGALNSCPSDYYNVINIKFYYATFLSTFKDLENKHNAYKRYVNLNNFNKYFINRDVFYLNFANVCNDLSFYNPDFATEAIKYYSEFLKYHPNNEEVVYLRKSLVNYKLQKYGDNIK